MRYTTSEMRSYAANNQFEFGVKFAIKEAADEIDRLRGALGALVEAADSHVELVDQVEAARAALTS